MSRPDHNSLSNAPLARASGRIELVEATVACDLVREAAPRCPAGGIALPPTRRAAVLRCAATQCATDSVHAHMDLRLFAAQAAPLGGHLGIERGQVIRRDAAGELITERMAFRFGRERSANACCDSDECVDAACLDCLASEHREAIGKRRHQRLEQTSRVLGCPVEATGQRGPAARELLSTIAGQADALPRHATAAHTRFNSIHGGGDVGLQGCERHESGAGTDAALSAPSR